MGVHGLLQFTKNASDVSHIRDFSGTTVAVDTYCWLHKGVYSCAEQLVKGEKTTRYVHYCIRLVNLLLQHDVKPILVFDGLHLPSKKEVEIKRHENRQRYKALAKQYLREGKLKEARDCFTRSVNVTSLMALELIQACRSLGVDCIVAPYEADAQLAYLIKRGIAQTIITEDSDLIVFGCDRIFYKMDSNGGGLLIQKSKLHMCSGIKSSNHTFDKFRRLCILSGCDYLPSLPGIGLSKAAKFFSLTNIMDIRTLLKKLPSYLKMYNLNISEDYIEGFIKAENTFLYQLVFCPLSRKIIPLNPYPPEINPHSMDYAGPNVSSKQAFQIALGNIDVNNITEIDNYDPDVQQTDKKSATWTCKTYPSIWGRNYQQLLQERQTNNNGIHDTNVGTNTKGKQVSVAINLFKKKSPKKQSPKKQRNSPKKRKYAADDLQNNAVDESHLQQIYSPDKKQQNTDLPPVTQCSKTLRRVHSPSKNPFKICKVSKSPKKVVRSRFFISTTEKVEETRLGHHENYNIESELVQTDDINGIETETFSVMKQSNNLGNFQWKKKNLSDNAIQLTSSPFSRNAFKPLDVTSSQENLESSQDNSLNESVGSTQLTVCSIDSMILDESLGIDDSIRVDNDSVCFDVSDNEEETGNCDRTKISSRDTSKAPTITKVNGSKTSNYRIGLSKNRIQAKDKSCIKRQLSLKDTLERFNFKKSSNIPKLQR